MSKEDSLATDEPLQLDRVEPASREAAASAGGVQCRGCNQPIVTAYYDINGVSTCTVCRETIVRQLQGPLGLGRIARAAGFGFAAAIAGSLLWYAVGAITGYEVGLIAVLVGLMVGLAVKRGGRGRGGWKLQTMAMVLTYSSICASYMPAVYHAIKDKGPHHETTTSAEAAPPTAGTSLAPSVTSSPSPEAEAHQPPSTFLGKLLLFFLGLVILFAIACAAPFLAGAQNIIGILLIGFALFEAWKINKAPRLVVSGPYRVGGGASATTT
jgi:hypothetical protein